MAEADIGDGIVERFVTFNCEGDACLGVVSLPKNGIAEVGVVVLVGGPQYRVGSHRQFTVLARHLAAAGLPTLRFDQRGMGDSAGEQRRFPSIAPELRAATTALMREAGVGRVVLWGLCGGASAALMFSIYDPRVSGIVAVNPWAWSPRGAAGTRIKHYYSRRLLDADFWRRLIREGPGAAIRKAGEFLSHVRTAMLPAPLEEGHDAETLDMVWRYLRDMEQGWQSFSGPVLVLLSSEDLTAREFDDWVSSDRLRRRLLMRSTCRRLAGADHTFSSPKQAAEVIAVTLDWLPRA